MKPYLQSQQALSTYRWTRRSHFLISLPKSVTDSIRKQQDKHKRKVHSPCSFMFWPPAEKREKNKHFFLTILELQPVTLCITFCEVVWDMIMCYSTSKNTCDTVDTECEFWWPSSWFLCGMVTGGWICVSVWAENDNLGTIKWHCEQM